MDKYLIKYLRDNSENELSSKYIDFFKAELDWHIYNSEKHITKSYHRNRKITWREKVIELLQYSNAIFNNSKQGSENTNILSTVNFADKTLLKQLGFDSFFPVWQPIERKNVFGDFKTINWHKKTQRLIHKEDFNTYLKPELHAEFEKFQSHFINQYTEKNFKGLLLNTDQYFYSKYFIDIFKKIQKPSFVFSHGMPGIYSLDVDNRSDYLMVWSEKIKKNYIDAGFNSSKIKVVGNPKFKSLEKDKNLRSDLSNILIIPLSSALWHQHEYDNIVVSDKSKIVLYLYKVQSVLKRIGVKKARYRPHPSIDKKWVHAFLDQDFYILDNEDLTTSLTKSSLVIGATSTVLLEALMNGVNYVLFDPKNDEDINMAGFKAVPPFDGSEKKIMQANDEEELIKLLKFNAVTEYSLLHDYIQEFDLSILKELIK